MKPTWTKVGFITVLIIIVGVVGVEAQREARPAPSPALASVGTGFTYQGSLTDGGSPANGAYDFEFKLYNDVSAGSPVGGTVTKGDVAVVDGLFTVELDFGGVFDGTALWLEVLVRPGASTGSYQQLLPRQALTAVPYASDADRLDGLDSADLYTRAEVDALLAAYNARITALENLLASVTLENSGQDFVFTGVNVHVRSGSGATDGTINGLGNLIVGYNEARTTKSVKSGSHNLVVGRNHNYVSYGGLVAGYQNSVSGGTGNTASDLNASVSGGSNNTASGGFSSVSGGMGRSVTGAFDWRAGSLFEGN